ncbi:MAG: chorismate mutase [Methanobacteriota archaeon]|nr:MAG: chorismate mutase [Euryarchaeota archaeon]
MSVAALRQEIEEIDLRIVELIAKRQGLAARLVPLKREAGLPIRDDAQRQHVLDRIFRDAVERKIDPVRVQQIFEILIRMSEERQQGCSGDGNLP